MRLFDLRKQLELDGPVPASASAWDRVLVFPDGDAGLELEPAPGDIFYASLLSRDRLKMAPLGSAADLRRELQLLRFQLSKFRLGPDYVRTFHQQLLKATIDCAVDIKAVKPADLERALRQDPNSRSSAYNLARAYRKLGRTDESRLLFEQLRNQEPDSLGELSQRRLNQVLTRKESQP